LAVNENQKLSYTIGEAASALGLSRATIYKMIKTGELQKFTWCGRTLIRADVLQRALDRASGQVAA
jgi:excisionase family DNA binding protein